MYKLTTAALITLAIISLSSSDSRSTMPMRATMMSGDTNRTTTEEG